MKTQIKYATILLLVYVVSCSSLKTTPQKIQEVTQKIQSKDYTIVVKYANPMRGRQIYLTSDYDLRIKNDSAFAYLPFYGVAYSAPYGGEGGIRFSEPMKGYTVLSNKRSDGWEIRFKVKAKENDYEIFMSIFNNGSAMITANSFNREAITFTGELKTGD
jgi:hypothetical protein